MGEPKSQKNPSRGHMAINIVWLQWPLGGLKKKKKKLLGLLDIGT